MRESGRQSVSERARQKTEKKEKRTESEAP